MYNLYHLPLIKCREGRKRIDNRKSVCQQWTVRQGQLDNALSTNVTYPRINNESLSFYLAFFILQKLQKQGVTTLSWKH